MIIKYIRSFYSNLIPYYQIKKISYYFIHRKEITELRVLLNEILSILNPLISYDYEGKIASLFNYILNKKQFKDWYLLLIH